ncbi:hypothetical protein PG997_010423 [Apiospora hydei]|uniref:Uncharacterized protein n=1 Tax=Apiospora hydei TaxID=1337664 RepID=A0ABR1VWY0_9PEZI
MPANQPQNQTSWGTTIYTLEGSIQEFFQTFGGTAVTKSDCDAKAAALGHWSYTVVAGSPEQARIVQFRAAKSKLDMTIMDLAASVHPDLVPKCSYHGLIGDDASPLHVYVMDKREGLCAFESRDSSVEGGASVCGSAVPDGAFFAEAWKKPQQVTPAAAEKMRQDIDADLNCLAQSLPERFLATVKQVRADLTGIIDWAEADISPFGLSVWGLESILGYSRKRVWYAYDNAEQLRAEFWRVFEAEAGTAVLSDEVRHAIKVARMAGMLLAWCFEYEPGAGRGKMRGLDVGLGRADAFCTGGI